MDELMIMYISETTISLKSFEDLLYNAQQSKSFDFGAVTEAFRLIHTIKGSSAMMQLDSLSEKSHMLENILSQIRDAGGVKLTGDNAALIDGCFEFLDYFSKSLVLLKAGDELIDSPELLAHLEALTDTKEEKQEVKALKKESINKHSGEHIKVFIKQCQMPHIRAELIAKSILTYCKNLSTAPKELSSHSQYGADIINNGFDIYYDLKDESKQKEMLLHLKKQPFFLKYETATGAMDEKKDNDTYVQISQKKINELINMVDELVTMENLLSSIVLKNNKSDYESEKILTQIHSYLLNTQALACEIGMTKVKSAFSQMRTLVRNMKNEKMIAVKIVGDDVPVDSGVLSIISDSLIHVIRNAVDHGIELPKDRIKAEKSEMGTITLEAKKAGSQVLVSVSDDGAGINDKEIMKKAIAKGLIEPDKAACTQRELFDILIAPGFTTSRNVTEFSGRGVGLDTAVKRIRDVGGDVFMESTFGVGTKFTLRIPMTLSVVSGLEVTLNGEFFVVPVACVKHVDYTFGDLDDTVEYNGEKYTQLKIDKENHTTKGNIIILKSDFGRYFFRVDNVGDIKSFLIKPLPNYVKNVLGENCIFSGCAVDMYSKIHYFLDTDKLVSLNMSKKEGEKKEMKVFKNGVINSDISDALYELGNVGVGQASIALGKMLGVGVSIGIPKVMYVDLDMNEIMGENSDEIAMGIVMSMEKTLGGIVLFIVDKEFIYDIVLKLTGRQFNDDTVTEDEEGLSTIQEVANVMAASYMKAIGTYTNIKIFLSPVMFGVDMISSLVSFPLSQMVSKCKHAISVDTSFGLMDKQGNQTYKSGRIIMLPDEESVVKLMEALK